MTGFHTSSWPCWLKRAVIHPGDGERVQGLERVPPREAVRSGGECLDLLRRLPGEGDDLERPGALRRDSISDGVDSLEEDLAVILLPALDERRLGDQEGQ